VQTGKDWPMKIPGSVSLFVVFLAGAVPANAFDCAKSTTKVEKAICSHRALGAADADMANAYAAVRDASSPSEKKMLALSQRRWIERRENYCGFEEGGALAACITKETMARRLLLQGAPESGPGASSPLVAVFLQQRGDAKLYDLDYTLARFTHPQSAGEKLFNLQSEKILAEAPRGPHDQELLEGQMLSREESFAISFASPDLLSVVASFYSFEGGAHGNGGVTNINIDMRGGAEIKASDVFAGEAVQSLTLTCRDQILARKQENYGAEKYVATEDGNYQESTITDHINDFRRWTIAAEKAIVTFDSYAIGAYAEGPYECEFEMPKLKALAKPDAPLP
jgi:uncharacterized protein YecT (DUF1311 family)